MGEMKGRPFIDLLRRQAGTGVPSSVKPYHLAAFIRPLAAPAAE
jgi:hypothetical protein